MAVLRYKRRIKPTLAELSNIAWEGAPDERYPSIIA